MPAPPSRSAAAAARLRRAEGRLRRAPSPAVRVRVLRRREIVLGALALALLLTALWLRIPETSRPSAADLLLAAERWRDSPLAPFLAITCFVVGGLVVFPVNLLTAATIVVLGPWMGGACALAGSVLSAIAVYEIGRLVPLHTARRVLGARGERLRELIVGHGIIAVATVRIVPVAPYSVVGYMAGAARVHRGDYVLGTALGMLPGVVLYAMFVDRARAAILDPHPTTWLLLLGALVLLASVALGVRAWRLRRAARAGGDSA